MNKHTTDKVGGDCVLVTGDCVLVTANANLRDATFSKSVYAITTQHSNETTSFQ